MDFGFKCWIEENWNDLIDGKKVKWPDYLGTLKENRFKRTIFALPFGQIKDWGFSLPNKSRLHAHQFENGDIKVHLDKFDPSKGFFSASNHWLKETGIIGPAISFFAILLIIKKLKA